MNPTQPQPTPDPLQMFIQLLQSYAFQSGLGQTASTSSPFGLGGSASAMPGFASGGLGGTSGGSLGGGGGTGVTPGASFTTPGAP